MLSLTLWVKWLGAESTVLDKCFHWCIVLLAGVIQPMKAIGDLCRSKKVFFHTDAAQGIGKIPINVNDMNIDVMSISGHKIYGPKGVGAIYIRRRPRVRLEAQISGGGQVSSKSFICPRILCLAQIKSRPDALGMLSWLRSYSAYKCLFP